MFCGSFVFRSGICPVLGLRWHMCESHDLMLPQCQFLYCPLCRLCTEFLGNLKWGLYFLCKVWSFIISLEAMLKLFQIIFTENKIKQRTDGDSVKACSEGTSVPVKIQIWVWHSGETSVSKSSAYCQYCRSCPWYGVKSWKYSNFSNNTTFS